VSRIEPYPIRNGRFSVSSVLLQRESVGIDQAGTVPGTMSSRQGFPSSKTRTTQATPKEASWNRDLPESLTFYVSAHVIPHGIDVYDYSLPHYSDSATMASCHF
jgi:hypothetical protein